VLVTVPLVIVAPVAYSSPPRVTLKPLFTELGPPVPAQNALDAAEDVVAFIPAVYPAIPTGEPSMLIYTAKRDAIGPNGQPVYSPNTSYGAWASFTSNTIKLNASSTVWQNFTSTGIRLQSTNSVYQTFDGTSIILASGTTANTTSESSAYDGPSRIEINQSRVSITGIPRATAFDMNDYRVGTEGAGNYRNLSALGYPPRQRIVIEDPDTGEAQLGLAVYYLDLQKINGTGPGANMGVQGDIAVVF